MTNYEEYLERVKFLEEKLNESENADYMASALCNLYKHLLTNKQFRNESVDAPTIEKRLVRCYRYIPNYILNNFNIDRIILGGLYISIDVCIMPVSLLNNNIKRNKMRCVYHPELDGLPSSKEVNYGTLKYINNTTACAIVRGSGLDDYLEVSSQYDYVTLF